jgi:hypothetical protein
MKFDITTTVAGTLLVAFIFLMTDKPTRFKPAPPPARVAVPAAAPAVAAEPERPAVGEHGDTVESLPDGPGRETTFYACAACHGMAIIKQQGMTRTQWDASIDWMIERHGMVKPDAADRDTMLDYLAAQFPPRARRGRDNPFLKN